MSQTAQRQRGPRLAVNALQSLRRDGWGLNEVDPVGLRYVTNLSVRGHWLIVVLLVVELCYRPVGGPARFATYVVLLAFLVLFNGYLQYRVASERPITWRWLLGLYGLDVFLVSAAVSISGGFDHYFFHLLYYPALAAFAAIFASFMLNMVWVTAASLIYVTLSLTVADGLDIDARDEKVLLARVAVMYAVVATVNVATRFERVRWQQAAARERELQRERVELSQTIHDTAAQSAYMIGMGIDTAKTLAGDTNPELTAALESTAQLSRSTVWELRHPINLGVIYEGRELNRALRSHTSSFMSITSVETEMTQTGDEPPLSVEARSLLFSIAHNALTNAYRHAEASRVSVELEFGQAELRLSISDDGSGLPDDYAERGQGFASMQKAAGRLGGRLVVEQQGRLGGATVTCTAPPARE